MDLGFWGVKPEGKRPQRRHGCRWVDNIKINLRKIGMCDVE
jgi:hypothetical protein